MTIREIASIVTEYLETLPHGTVIATTEALDWIFGCKFISGGKCLLGDEMIDSMLLFDIDDEINRLAGEKGIILDSSHCAGFPVGLPYDISRVVLKDDRSCYARQPHFLFQKEGKHTMTWFHLIKVAYSQEYGDPTLPKLADMVSDTPDPHKDIILDYLSEHCIAGCPGIVYDVINPDRVIGSGHLYSDDKYFWTDYFTNYVRKYNIPVPAEFRTHILENYTSRKLRHAKHRLLKSIRITNNPYLGYRYTIYINQNGSVQYSNNLEGTQETAFMIDQKDADYIIHPITESFFCYDKSPNGKPIVDGYHWEIEFYNAKGLADKIEGWPGEPKWRYEAFRKLLAFVERETGKDLGSGYMIEFEKQRDTRWPIH